MLAAFLLTSTRTEAARYDPDFDRAALRQAATDAHSTIVAATARPLEPDQAAAIGLGLDEGLRLARSASASASSLAEAARKRDSELEAALKGASDAAIRKLAEPVEAERRRWEKLSSERAQLKEKADALPEDERKKLQAPFEKAASALQSADETLRPLEAALRGMGEQAIEMREARRQAYSPFVEVSSAAANVVWRAEELPARIDEAKSRLAELNQEPRDAARARAWKALELPRELSRLLFQSADMACNRADDFRRRSAAFDKAFEAFEKSRLTAAAGPGAARASLDEAYKALAFLRERLEKPPR